MFMARVHAAHTHTRAHTHICMSRRWLCRVGDSWGRQKGEKLAESSLSLSLSRETNP